MTAPKTSKRWVSQPVVHMMKNMAKKGMSTREIGAICGVKSGTVSYWLRSEHNPGDLARKPPKMGKKDRVLLNKRRKLISKLATELVVRGGTEYPAFCSAGAIQDELFRRNGTKISVQTVRNDLAAEDLVSRRRPKVPCIRHDNYQDRLRFCKNVVSTGTQAKNVVFSDEKIFTTNDFSCPTAYCKKGQNPPAREHTRWPHRIMVWAAIGVGYRKLIFLADTVESPGARRQRVNKARTTSANKASTTKEKKKQARSSTASAGSRMTAVRYIEDILTPCMPELTRRRDCIFMQDGAPCHTAKVAKEFIESFDIALLKWVARSPDLNPIERLWAILQRRVSDKHHPQTLDELLRAIQKEWDALSQRTINALVLGFDARVLAVKKVKGAWPNDKALDYKPRKRR